MYELFNRTPRKVAAVDTAYRRIQTEIPPAQSVQMLEELKDCEPRSMRGQPPIIWDHAKGCNVYDPYGNKWLDFSSGVLVANSGHANDCVLKAIQKQLDKPLLHSYCFANKPRHDLVKIISEIAPKPLEKVFVLSTGSEAAECAIKLSRTFGKSIRDDKIQIVTFDDGFHGRTLGSLLAGGTPAAKRWVTNIDPDIIQVPYPNAFKYAWADENDPDYSDDKCFDMFLKYLEERGGKKERIAAIMGETFQGGWVQLMPVGFAKRLRKFCDEKDILLVFDEIQAGFGRTGKMFGFEHYGIVPDIMLLGKGISSSLPVSAVVGRADVMNQYGPNEMTSTHTGNPVTNAASAANIYYIVNNDLPAYALDLGERVVRPRMAKLQEKYNDVIGVINGKGLVWGLIFADKQTKKANKKMAFNVVEKAYEMGLLFFAPVGAGGTIKICPPLTIPEDALIEGIDVLDHAIEAALKL